MLKELGLNSYEENVYLTLLKFGPLTAPKIAKLSKVPYGRIYDVLQSLERKGFVKVISKAPKVFVAEDPEKSIEIYINRKIRELENKIREIREKGKELIEKLREIERVREESKFTIMKGLESSIDVRIFLIKKVQREHLAIVSPNVTTPKIFEIEKELEKKVKEGVKFKIIYDLEDKNCYEKAQYLRKIGVEIKHMKIHDITVIIVDESIVCLEMIDPIYERIAFLFENKAFGRLMKILFNNLWNITDTKISSKS